MNDKPDEKYLRLAADFDNFRKRVHAEQKQAIAHGNEKLLLEIADVLDAIERASKSGEYDMGKLLEQILKKHGLVRIETVGKPFDPATMEAVAMKPPDAPEQSGMVEQEVRAGYLMHDSVIRPARVSVYQ
jgi:molecular chaperone GrpE